MTTAKANIELFTEMSGKGYEAARQVGEMNLHLMEKMLGRQMDAFSLFMETGLQQAQMASEAKGYSELVKGQIELTQDLSKRVLEESRTNMQLAGETREEYRAWIEQGVDEMRQQTAKAQQAA